MAYIKFNDVGISAISACVPKNVNSNTNLNYLIPADEIDKTINTIGIKEKRYASESVCASDLCIKAAEKLFTDNGILKESIDILLFLSQTPDYRIPATSPVIQSRLGLPNTVACLDLSLGCSGYVYALSTAFAYASLPSVNRVLLLVGETFSKITSPFDKVNAPLYGDAGTATLIEKGNFGDSHFDLFSDGSGKDAVIIKAGGFRQPVTCENLELLEVEDGNKRSENQIFMDGMDVFNFAMRVVPKGIRELTAKANIDLSEIDYLLFHQANKFMTDFFVKKLKFDINKVPYCLHKFGNTSSASIPLTIVSELENKLERSHVIMTGFGAGLSWGTVYLNFFNCKVSSLIEY